MTPEQIEQERAAFEAWYLKYLQREHWLQEDCVYIDKREDGTYYADLAQTAWQAWLERAQQGGWISVEDRLPDRSDIAQFFIIYDENQKDKLKFGVAMFTGWKIENPTAWHNWIVYGNYTPEYVTHWQPLPKPPAGDHT